MATTNYHTVDGEIQGETTNGVRTDYLTDALGSVVATVNQGAQVVNTYRYKPYGERLAKTGVGTDPRFGWIGGRGSRRTARRFSDQYNQAGHYGTNQAQWTNVDAPLSIQSPLGHGRPVSAPDPIGFGVAGSCRFSVPSIDLAMSHCECSCDTCLGVDARCHHFFEFLFYLEVWAHDCKSCVVFQWMAENGGGWGRDDDEGWPYPWSVDAELRDKHRYSMNDTPHWGPRWKWGCSGPTNTRSFVTCVRCDGECACWSWGFREACRNCRTSDCKLYPPRKIFSGGWPEKCKKEK